MADHPLPKTARFTTKGRIVIPAKIRQEFQIELGTKASVTLTSEGILLRPITRPYLKSIRGSLRGRRVMKAMMADRKHERSL